MSQTLCFTDMYQIVDDDGWVKFYRSYVPLTTEEMDQIAESGKTVSPHYQSACAMPYDFRANFPDCTIYYPKKWAPTT